MVGEREVLAMKKRKMKGKWIKERHLLHLCVCAERNV